MMSEIPSPVFKSCIKIKGIHLLPPMITEKRRIELQRFKQQAIKLEKRLQNCRELKKNLEELLNLQPLSERTQSANTFGDNSHIEALGISSSRKSHNSQKKINLSKDIVDVSEYSSDGIKIIRSEIDTNHSELNQGQASNTTSKIIELNECLSDSCEIGPTSQPTSNKNNIGEQHGNDCPILDLSDLSTETFLNVPYSNNVHENISPIKSPRPRLIRSNSYTLEAPSPILLAHLEKCSKQEEKHLDLPNEVLSSRHWASLENNYVPFENSEFSSINTVYNIDKKKNEDTTGVEENLSPRIEVIQTDISVQQITVNGNHEENEIFENTFNLSNPDSQLMQVLQKIPENYSKQIIDLIEMQRTHPPNKVETFKNVQKQYSDEKLKRIIDLPENSDILQRNKSASANDQEESMYESMLHSDDRLKNGIRSYSSAASVSPSQSLYYSVSSAGTLLPSSPSIRCIDVECEGNKLNHSEKYSTEKSPRDLIDLYGSRVSTNKVNFNRELFPQLENVELYDIKQHWAASVIGAHVKGYLTRRLLKTERVQSLIETIKDALLCALELHSAENIEEADVELHRRLINQVSAACYAFHDIFFSLSIPEQMSVIALDRHRRIEKAKRPASAPISQRSRSNSRHSSTKSSTPQSRSLTKV